MHVLTKRLKDASIAHRLRKGYVGACANIHGHTYHFEITIAMEDLDQFDMLLDFKDIATICDKFIQDSWDHGMLVSRDDETLMKFLADESMKFWPMPEGMNTTAEQMSKLLAERFWEDLKHVGLKELTMRVWETDTSKAEFTVRG